MSQYHVKIYQNSKELPQLDCHNFFHSTELFCIMEQVSGNNPYMIVAFNSNEQPVAHLLAITFRRGSWLPPYLYTQGRIYGEGEYNDGINREVVFELMIEAATRKLRRHFCFYIEVSDMKQKMFGYKSFRRHGYFPIQWQEIHNSLHSKLPEERITPKMLEKINHIYENGVVTREVQSQQEIDDFYKLLYNFYRFKLRRIIPPKRQFEELNNSKKANIFVTLYKGKIIGGCACVFSEGNAYLWYLASRRKRYPTLHPNMMTVWNAIKYAHGNNYQHIFFMDVGLPWKKNPFREFILSFGGKPVGMYRWFRINNKFINRILTWIHKE